MVPYATIQLLLGLSPPSLWRLMGVSAWQWVWPHDHDDTIATAPFALVNYAVHPKHQACSAVSHSCNVSLQESSALGSISDTVFTTASNDESVNTLGRGIFFISLSLCSTTPSGVWCWVEGVRHNLRGVQPNFALQPHQDSPSTLEITWLHGSDIF